MANEIKTRIQLKYDSYENWTATAKQFKLRPGEVAVANINGANGANLNNGIENTIVQPTILFKVGIGDPTNEATWKTFNQLPWASALAADVYAWAKQSENDFVTHFLALKTTDGTTMQAKLDAVFATDAELTNAISSLSQQVSAWLADYYTKSEVDALIEGVEKKIPGTDDFGVMSVTADANKALVVDNKDPANPTIKFKIDNTGTKGNVALTEDQNGLKANITVATGDAAGQVKIAGKNVSVNGLAALAYKATITKGDFPTFETDVAAVKVTNATNADTATTATTAQQVENSLTISVAGTPKAAYNGADPVEVNITATDLGLSGAMHFVGAGDTLPSDPKDGDVYLHTGEGKEYVAYNNVWVELGDEGSHALKSVTITGTDGLTGGGTLEQNRTIGIADLGVTTAKIANDAVTEDKLSNDVLAKLNTQYYLATVESATEGKAVIVTDAPAFPFHLRGENEIKVSSEPTADNGIIIDVDLSAYAKKTDLITDTNTTYTLNVGDEGAHNDEAVENPHLVLLDSDDTIAADHQISGSKATTVKSDANGNITIETDLSAYATTKYVGDQNAVVLAEAQKYTDEAIDGLHAIATSGSIYDVAEGHNTSVGADDTGAKYLVFNCGSATEVI